MINSIDIALFRLINNLPHPFLADQFFNFIHLITLTGIAFLAVFIRSSYVDNYKGQLKLILLGILNIGVIGFLSEIILKNIIQRPRPFITLTQVHTVGYLPESFSMPSGQTLLAFSTLAFVLMTSKNKLVHIIAFVLALLTAFDRVYVGHHYPSDVIVGAVLGFTFTKVFFGYVLRLKLLEKDKLKS